MTTYRIAEAARRSGFSAATLRYYEDIGLVPPAERTTAGYRRYGDRDLERLAFVARAKQLGCTLDEIADLAEAWDGGSCGPVQRRLRELVDTKVAETRRGIAELASLAADLERAAAALRAHRTEGPCDDRCACAAAGDTGATPTAVVLAAKPMAGFEPAIACTLDGWAIEQRLGDWSVLLDFVTAREAIDGGVRLTLGADVPLDEVARLAAAEQDCCRFFAFAITVDGRGTALEVRAPMDAADLVASLFGVPT